MVAVCSDGVAYCQCAVVHERTVYEGLFTLASAFLFVVVGFVISSSAYTSVLLSVLSSMFILIVPLEAYLQGHFH